MSIAGNLVGPWKKYKDDELEAALKRAFVDNRASYIRLDSLREGQFLFESAALGCHKGWIEEQEVKGADGGDQDYFLKYTLTEKGKRHFGL